MAEESTTTTPQATPGSHLSIGEVLALLLEDFPDVTISKIRFLESQGLIEPERTASGYRRFYQRDFDRLQWILTQQRDHYLPLKVIRDRLDAGEWTPPEHPPAPPSDGQMTLLAPVIDIGTGAARPASETSDLAPSDADLAADERDADDRAPASGGGDDATTDADDPAGDGTPGGDTAADDTADDDTAADDTDVANEDATNPDESDRRSSASERAVEAGEAVGSSSGNPSVTSSTARSSADDGGDHDRAEDLGMALTIDEMVDASGCDVAMVRELERFGLIAGRNAGPTVLYDADALTIARHAAQFRTYGLDPRHLRTFLVGAQREVSLLAQVVEPLRHRRDPETRRKSVETMEDLTDLAASLRAILMRKITEEELPSR